MIFLVGCCVTGGSLADTDYSNIRKDIKVMNKIITGAIEGDEACGKCRASVRGTYLAGQGAIFVISPRRSYFEDLSISDADWDVEHLEFAQLEHLPEMIGDIVSDVGIAIREIDLDDADISDLHEHELRAARIHREPSASREARNELRSLRREMRQLRDELRQQEIELIRAEDDMKEDLEESIGKLEDNMKDLQKKSDALNDVLDKERERREQDRQNALKAARESRQQQTMKLEQIVLATMCDYGASLKNLPMKERVTLLFEREGKRWTDNQTKMYVLNKKDLMACQSEDLNKDDLIKKSVSYRF
jgi:hypothetical protein